MHVKAAVRGLLRTPSFAAAIVFTIALGVGASSAMFGVVYATLLRPLPYPDAHRLVVVWEKWQVSRDLNGIDPAVAARLAERSVVMDRALPVWRAQNHVFEEVAGFWTQEFSLSGAGNAEQVQGLIVTSQLFRVLGVAPVLGRAFRAEEDQPGTDEVVLISDRLWTRRFGRDPHVIGRTIGVDGIVHTIVGIMPADFHPALPNAPRDPDVIAPLPHAFEPDRHWALLTAIARLRPAVTLADAQADMSAVVRRMAETNPRYKSRDANVVWLKDEIGHDSRPALLVLFGATLCVLLIGCANVASLLMLRARGRRQELAIRAALGADRWQLARHVLAETIGLAALGGGAGLVFAHWATAALVAVVPEQMFPRLEDARVDWVVMTFGVVMAALTGLLASMVPVWSILRGDRRGLLRATLNEALRTATTSRGQRSMRRALVIGQVAIAMVLLVCGGLLAETYLRLTHVDLGVDPTRVLTFRVTLPQARYSSDASRLAFQEALTSRLAALPGVAHAALTSSLPVGSEFFASASAGVEGRPLARGDFVSVATVSPDFFAAAGLRLAYGRLLDATDARADVAVVSRAVVHRYWPSVGTRGPEPVGRKLLIGQKWCTVVGVVDDVKYAGPEKPAEPIAYVPLAYWALGNLAAVVRTTGNPVALAPLARQALAAVDPDLPILDVRTLEDVVSRSVAPPRFRFLLIVVLATLAVLLAVIGLYGLIAQSVAERRREIGIRIALGAARSRIARMVLLEGLAHAAVGIVLGIAASLAATRLLAGFLFGVEATNLTTYASVAITLTVVGAIASWAPARRAMQADPAVVLRAE